MFFIIPVVCGLIGGIISGKLGFSINELNWWLVICPWWLLAAAINYKIS